MHKIPECSLPMRNSREFSFNRKSSTLMVVIPLLSISTKMGFPTITIFLNASSTLRINIGRVNIKYDMEIKGLLNNRI